AAHCARPMGQVREPVGVRHVAWHAGPLRRRSGPITLIASPARSEHMPPKPPLIGTYEPPALKLGETVTCLYRNRDCKVTSWTEAPIPWPRVQSLGQKGGCGLWVNDTLARAIRMESALALGYWFGTTPLVVWRWRKAF